MTTPTYPLHPRCSLHDEALDRDTGICDHCARDARLDCTDCHGVGQLPYFDALGFEWARPCRCQDGPQ